MIVIRELFEAVVNRYADGESTMGAVRDWKTIKRGNWTAPNREYVEVRRTTHHDKSKHPVAWLDYFEGGKAEYHIDPVYLARTLNAGEAYDGQHARTRRFELRVTRQKQSKAKGNYWTLVEVFDENGEHVTDYGCFADGPLESVAKALTGAVVNLTLTCNAAEGGEHLSSITMPEEHLFGVNEQAFTLKVASRHRKDVTGVHTCVEAWNEDNIRVAHCVEFRRSLHSSREDAMAGAVKQMLNSGAAWAKQS